MSSSSNSTASNRSIDAKTFKKENLVFEDPVWEQEPKSNTRYARIQMRYMNNGVKSKLVIRFPPMSTYGVGDMKDNKTNEVTGHSVCFLIPKGENQDVVCGVFDDIYKASCEFISKKAAACSLDPTKYNNPLMVEALVNNPLRFPKNKTTGLMDTTKPRRFYTKLVEYKPTENKEGKMVTIFDDARSFDPLTGKMSKMIDPLTVRTSVEMIPSIDFESIYIGSKPSIQIKLPRAAVTRIIENNVVEPEHEAVGLYMSNLNPNSSDLDQNINASLKTEDPASML